MTHVANRRYINPSFGLLLRRSLHENVERENGEARRDAPTKRRRKSPRDPARDSPTRIHMSPLGARAT